MKILIIALSIVLLTACSTTYHRSGATGGYTETQLQLNIFTINFDGNGYTHAEQAADFALLRAADLTERNGFTYFIVNNEKSSTSYSAYTSPQQSTTTGMNTYSSGGATYIISSPSSKLTIMCLDKKPDYVVSYEAKFLKASLVKKYKL